MLNRSSKNLTTEQEAYDYALDILSYRDYSRKDMELKLKRKGADAVSYTEEQERAEKALQSCLKRNPKKYDPATQEGRAAIGRYLYARGFASKYIQKSINNIHGSVILMDDC